MANQDDLSVNINVGVNLDQQSINKAKEELQFLIELEKELGLEGVKKIKVGGYSTSQSPDRTVRNKAASQIEKMGGDWSGVDLAEKAEVELAKRFNEAAKELSKAFNVDFIPDFAASIGEADFALPKDSMPAEKIKEAIEDFVMNAAGEVTISPAMFMAAAEKVMKNNPGLNTSRGMDTISGIIKPTEAFGKVANYDEKLSKEFQDFISKVMGDNPDTASKVSEFLLSKLKVLMSGIIDDAQKARERVFTSLSVSEGDDTAENVVRYADDAARRAVAIGEQARGLQAGSTAMFAPGLIPEKFKPKPGAVSDPQQLLNVLIGEYSDEVTGAIMAAVPDPSKVAAPIAQILMNPYILGDKFATGYQDEIAKAMKAKAPQVAEKVSPVTTVTGGGALNPDINLLEKYLRDQRALVEQQGKTFMVGLDTEFNSQISEKLTELSAVIQDGSGKFVEIFKFLQLPNDLDAMMRGWEQLPKAARAGQAKDAAGLAARGQVLGIPKESIGVPDDAEANFMQFRGKISKLVDVINLLNNLGIQLTGSNFAAAEAANIKKAIEYVNSGSSARGLETLGMPDLSNVFDPAKMAQKLSGGSAELAKIFDSPEAKKGISGALGHLIKNIAEQFPDFIARYSDQFKMSESGSFKFKAPGGEAPAHYALSDATASLIVKDFIEQMGDTAATLLIPVAKDLNTKVQAAAGGSGGGKGPNVPLAAGDKPEEPFKDRSAQSLQRILLTADQYKKAVATLTEAEKGKIESRLALLTKSTSQATLLAELAEKELKFLEIRKEIADTTQGSLGFAVQQKRGMQGPLTQDTTQLIESGGMERFERQAKAAAVLKNEILELTAAGQRREIETIAQAKAEARHGHVSEQLTMNFRKQLEANIENAQAGKAATSSIKAQMQQQVTAQKEVQRQTQSLMNTWVTSRYALYDVGNFYANFSQQLFRLTRQIFNTTDSYRRFETAFTSVERAMQLPRDAADDLRQQFILLSETIPVSFEDISKIATLGAQMGITARGIVGFTETVAQFASVTGISAETVAQQFGRIAELADVDSSEFVNLGSAVSYAGVNAVATESEILTLSQSIAAVSNQVGITAPEIIGLGTALASVGIPAEQARGVFTRVFADIDRAASTGGKSLENLAAVTGMSAEKIQGSWGKEGAANEVFIALLQGLDASENLTATFDSLNIVETREINTLTRLAKNMNVVQQALGDSSMAYEDASFLGESFGKTVDNLDSKILIFKNNLDSLLSTFSQGFVPTMEFVLDAGSGFLKFLKSLENSWLLKGVLPAAAVFIALGGVLTGTGAILAKLTAQVYAFRVAMINTANNPTAIGGFAAQVRALTSLGSGVFELRENVEGMNTRGLIEPMDLAGKGGPSMFANQEKQNAYLLKERNLYVAVGKAVKETNQVKELERTGKLTDIQLARIEADQVNKAISARRLQIEQLENSASAYDVVNQKSVPSAANLQGQKLRNNYEQMYVATVRGEVVTISAANKAALERLLIREHSTAATKKEAAAILATTTAVNLETTAATRAMNGIGAVVSKAFTFIAIAGTIITVVNAIATAIGNLNKINLLEGGGGLESFREAIRQDTKDLASGELLPSEVITTATIEQKVYKQVVDDSAGSIGNFTGVSKEFTNGFKTTTEEIKKQTVALGTNTKEWLANAFFQNEQLQKWVEENPDVFNQMQEALAEAGTTFDQLIKDLVAESQGADVNPLKGIEDALDRVQARRQQLADLQQEATGRGDTLDPNLVAEMNLLDDKVEMYMKLIALINEMGGALGSALNMQVLKDAIRGAFGLGGELDEIEETVGGIAEAVRTVVDYASDLAGIFSRIFEIRFGQQQSLDDIATGWANITKKADDAKEAITAANNEINELTADKSILEYQLSVAERYGDEKRAALIRAKLAKVNNSVAKASENLADSTAAASTETEGNSEAAIDNRQALMGQLSSYAALVEMYAKTGLQGTALQAKVDELKASFLAQGLQAGYSNAQLQPYLNTFDSMREAIEKTPRKVTVEFNSNISAADQALKEYLAKLASANTTVTTNFVITGAERLALLARIQALQTLIAVGQQQLNNNDLDAAGRRALGSGMQSANREIVLIQAQLAQTRAKGGIILGPGSGTSDSIPAMLSNGEYVVRASAVNTYGLDFMNALNQQKVGFQPASQSVSVSSSSESSVVYLSPEDRALLRAAVDRPINLYTDNGKIASSANAGNVLLAQRGAR